MWTPDRNLLQRPPGASGSHRLCSCGGESGFDVQVVIDRASINVLSTVLV